MFPFCGLLKPRSGSNNIAQGTALGPAGNRQRTDRPELQRIMLTLINMIRQEVP